MRFDAESPQETHTTEPKISLIISIRIAWWDHSYV